jgi:hypothetical protein
MLPPKWVVVVPDGDYISRAKRDWRLAGALKSELVLGDGEFIAM